MIIIKILITIILGILFTPALVKILSLYNWYIEKYSYLDSLVLDQYVITIVVLLILGLFVGSILLLYVLWS